MDAPETQSPLLTSVSIFAKVIVAEITINAETISNLGLKERIHLQLVSHVNMDYSYHHDYGYE